MRNREGQIISDGYTSYFWWRILTLISLLIGLGYLGYYRLSDQYKPIDISYETAEENTPYHPDQAKPSQAYDSGSNGYYYKLLNDREKAVYGEILEACGNYSTNVVISQPAGENETVNAILAVQYDFPQYYWLHGGLEYSMNSEMNVTSVSFEYRGNEKSTVDVIMSRTNDIVAGMPMTSDYDKAKYFYEWIIDNTVYDETDSGQKQTVLSVLSDGNSVCAGYAKTFKLLCGMAGIECAVVSGEAENRNTGEYERHMWNFIRLEDQYYWVDPTWGDPTGQTEDNKVLDYLCMTDTELYKDHQPDKTIRMETSGNLAVEYPVCTDTSYNYYKMNGLYFDYYDEQALKQFIIEQSSQGKSEFEMQFGSESELSMAISDLLENQKIYEYISGATGVQYSSCQYFERALNSLKIKMQE